MAVALIEIKNNDSFGMFEKGAAGEITVNGKHVGVVGKISRSVLNNFENGKLAKDDVLYVEFCYEDLIATKKSISYETSFPSIIREYNFIVKNGVHFCDYSQLITEASPFVVNVEPIDIYFGTGVAKGSSAVLIKIEYNAITRTLAADEIEAIETNFKPITIGPEPMIIIFFKSVLFAIKTSSENVYQNFYSQIE